MISTLWVAAARSMPVVATRFAQRLLWLRVVRCLPAHEDDLTLTSG
jgi:hypothetical protein